MSKIFPLIFLMMTSILNSVFCQKKYTLTYNFTDKDTSYPASPIIFKNAFDTRADAEKYIGSLPSLLLANGYVAASVDSVVMDSLSARLMLYLGTQFHWSHINTDSIDAEVLRRIGWNEKEFSQKRIDFSKLKMKQGRLLNYFENSGYPFAEVSLEDVGISGEELSATMKVRKGPLYHIDSIRVFGDVKIKNSYLQHYLDIYNGSIYNNQKLSKVSKLIKELPFLAETKAWDLTMLGSGAVLNLYLTPKKSSQINVLVGFLPGNSISGKTQITADVHLDLKNALGAGENIMLTWQQLQPQSPQLNIGYSHPFLFNSKFGIDLSFDLLKRDSAYLQLNSIIGIQYLLSANQRIKVFYQNEKNYLLGGGIDTNQVIFSKKLPLNIDVSSANMGLGYYFTNTDYRFNPRTGNELQITASAGIKRVKKNNDIINLKDPLNPSFDFNSLYDSIGLKTYQFKIVAAAAHYFSFGNNNVLKTELNGGLLQSPQTFQNELFRIGGYDLLRGFDEESIYANRYAVFTAEYRYLLGINSYFFGFSDVGLTQTRLLNSQYSNSFISGGLGLEFETKFGLLNLSYGVGKRNDVKFDLRNSSKIHFGYINYF